MRDSVRVMKHILKILVSSWPLETKPLFANTMKKNLNMMLEEMILTDSPIRCLISIKWAQSVMLYSFSAGARCYSKMARLYDKEIGPPIPLRMKKMLRLILKMLWMWGRVIILKARRRFGKLIRNIGTNLSIAANICFQQYFLYWISQRELCFI